MELSNTRDQSKGPSNSLLHIMRLHPLYFYFLMALGFTWACELIVFNVAPPNPSPLLYLALEIVCIFVGPTLSAFLMTAVTEGYAGIVQLLRRYVLWRVGILWYLFVLLGIPVLGLIAFLFLPGALSAFRLPGLSFLPTYLMTYLLGFVLGPLWEEPGWRGFALPRLQKGPGPLVGTLLLGVLWGLWHWPLFFFPGTAQYAMSIGSSFVDHLLSFVMFVIWASTLAVTFTWVFNNTRGSLLLVMLLHASANMSFALGMMLFPSLPLNWLVIFLVEDSVWLLVAVLIIVATRGRLSYERDLRSVALPAEGAPGQG